MRSNVALMSVNTKQFMVCVYAGVRACVSAYHTTLAWVWVPGHDRKLPISASLLRPSFDAAISPRHSTLCVCMCVCVCGSGYVCVCLCI